MPTSHYGYVKNLGTGETHRVIVSDGERFSQEECNIDNPLAETNHCGHCWKREEERDA